MRNWFCYLNNISCNIILHAFQFSIYFDFLNNNEFNSLDGSGFLPTPTLPSLPNSPFTIGRVGVGKKPSGFLPTPSLPNSLFSIGRVGVGKKPSGFLPTPTLPTSSFQFSFQVAFCLPKSPKFTFFNFILGSMVTLGESNKSEPWFSMLLKFLWIYDESSIKS